MLGVLDADAAAAEADFHSKDLGKCQVSELSNKRSTVLQRVRRRGRDGFFSFVRRVSKPKSA